jgi:hypothetical protein
MLDEKEREKIALKKFSLVAPVINGQADNQKKYFKKLAAEPIDMPHYGLKRYACGKNLSMVAVSLQPARSRRTEAGLSFGPGKEPSGN